MATKLKDIEVGSLVKLNENGNPVEFYVAKHNYETDLNGLDRTLLVRKEVHSAMAWHRSNVNAYASSDIDAWLNGDYKATLDEIAQNQIGETEFRHTPGNGTTAISTLKRGVFLLSVTELGLSGSYAPTEGTALPIDAELRNAYFGETNVVQWTRSPYTSATTTACAVTAGGSIGNYSCSATTYYARPAFTLSGEEVFVYEDGTIAFDEPVISGEDGDLGKKTKNFSLEYSVATVGGNGTTVTETFNGEVVRTYDAAEGELQIMSFDVANLVDGIYEIGIKAESKVGLVSERNYTFLASPINIQSGGTVQELQDETGVPVFPATLAKSVFAEDGRSLQRFLDESFPFHHLFSGLVVERIAESCLWTVPKAANQTFFVIAVGAGGGAGGGAYYYNSGYKNSFGGGGGAAGSVICSEMTLKKGEVIEIVCGAGGANGAGAATQSNNNGADGANGGDTHFGTNLTAPGGAGGGGAKGGSKGSGGAGGAGEVFDKKLGAASFFGIGLRSDSIVSGVGGVSFAGVSGRSDAYGNGLLGGSGGSNYLGASGYTPTTSSSHGGCSGAGINNGTSDAGGGGGVYVFYFKED